MDQPTFEIMRNGERSGPYTVQEVITHLDTGHLSKDDMAWQQGMDNWAPISEISEFGHSLTKRVSATEVQKLIHLSPKKFRELLEQSANNLRSKLWE
tara:strand:+ start:45 stop:335 length:291 start_codon:yes stop_codon:yes gene_type:complete